MDTAFWITCAAILVLLCASAFVSGSETALTAASRAKLRALAERGGRAGAGAAAALQVTEDRERLVGALLLGNNLAVILSTALATALLVRVFGGAGIALATLAMTALVLLLGEVMPKTLAITRPEQLAAGSAPAIRVLIALLAPFVTLVRALARGLLRLFGVQADPEDNLLALREEIAGAIQLGHHEGAVEKENRDRLLGALDLGERMVEEIMRHRRQIEMIDAEQTPDAILTQVLASPYTRLPVYRGSDDNILGVVHAKDLLREVDRLVRGVAAPGLADLDIVKVAMKPYFIPETTTLDEQMREFLKRRTHFALVVDEYGGLEGLITLEDILEEIVGEITDEHDVVSRLGQMQEAPDGGWLVEGAMTIRDLNRAMDWTLPDDEANTLAGLVIHEAMMIPVEGQVFRFHGFRFEVVTRRENRITRLKIRRI